jgi:hypothetical protein
MKQFLQGFTTLIFALLLLFSCSDPTKVGSELLEDDQARIGFVDTLRVIATTEKGDSVRTFSPFTAQQLRSYLFGNFVDPYFGKASSNLYAQVRLQRISPDFSAAMLDSIVLVLPYELNGIYGNLDQDYGIEVLRITERMSRTEEYYSNKTFETQQAPLLGSYVFRPNLDTIQVIDYADDSPDTLRFSHLRVPLDLAFGEELLALDTTFYQSDTSFLNHLRGISLRPSLETEGMLSFNLFTTTAGIYLYYKQDTVPKQFVFELDEQSVRFAHYEHDFSQGVVAAFLDNSQLGDSLLFLQGMEGLNIKLEFPDLDRLSGLIINKAELEISLANLEGDDLSLYLPADQLIISSPDDEGGLNVISDVTFSSANLAGIFGGNLQTRTNDQPAFYRMNISSHFQKMVDKTEPNSIYISVFPKAERAFRAILRGPGQAEFPLRLRVTYTKY